MRKNAEARVGDLCGSVADFGLPILSLPCGECERFVLVLHALFKTLKMSCAI
jgi:hypothetical protein